MRSIKSLLPILILIVFLVTGVSAQQRITAEFYGAKLGTFIDVISKIANKNIIWDQNAIKNKDSLVYLSVRKPVSIDTLFKLALKENNLTYIKQGNLYIIKESKENLFIVSPLITKYLGKEIFDSFVELIRDNISPTAEVKIYKTSNAIYVRDTKENVEKITKLVEEYKKPLQKEAEKLAKLEEERTKELEQLKAKKANLESLLVKKEVNIPYKDFKEIEDELIENLSSYGRYKYNQKTGKLTIIEVKSNISKISKIIAKAQKIDIKTKCFYVRALEPVELLITIKENYLTKYGSVLYKSKETSKALGVEKQSTGGSGAGTTGGGGSYAAETEKNVITSLPKVCITDVPEVVDKIYKDFSDVLLKRPYQIAIEARIVQIESGFKRDLGIQWGFTASGGTGNVGYGVSTGKLTGYMFDFPAGNIGTLGSGASMSIGIVKGLTTSLDMQLSALEQIGKSKILSRPKVITIDGEGAEISQGIEVPYSTFGAAGGAAISRVQFKKALLKLNVIPRTTLDGNIIMNIELTQDVPDFGRAVNGQPPINTKSITSKVIAKDGTTIVIGGILEKTEQENEYGVPGLKNIPLLGWLFKSKAINVTNKELLIFITPKIIYE
ncbi:pilus assembly protein PilQ [Persephonella sp.]